MLFSDPFKRNVYINLKILINKILIIKITQNKHYKFLKFVNNP